MRRTARLAVLAMVAAITTAGCGYGDDGDSGGEDGEIKVGISTTLTGSLGDIGNGGRNGIELALADLNADGGVLGEQVSLVAQDDDLDPARGGENARSMIVEDDVKAIFGPVASSIAASEEAVADEFQVPIFFFSSNSAALLNDTFTEYAFQVVPNTVMEPRAVAAYLAEKSQGTTVRIGTFAPDYSFGHDSVDGFLAALDALDVDYEVVSQQFPALDDPNIGPALNDLVAASPDYVYNAQYGNDLVTFTKQASQFNFFDKTTLIAMFGVKELEALGDGVPPGTVAFNRAPFWSLGQEATDFVTRYQAEYDELPSEWALLAYTAVQAWAEGVEEAGTFDGEPVSDALSGATVSTIRGDITFRECDHQAEVSEYLGELADKPDPEYGVPLWTAGSEFEATFDEISDPC